MAKNESTDQIGSILSERKLVALREAYRTGRKSLDGILRGALPGLYPPSAAYSNAILDIFYDDSDLPGDAKTSRPRLSAADRERCVIALLGSRGDQFNLALHIYLGLMLGVSPEEVANILLLVGAYTGVDNFSDAISVELKALTVLANASSDAPAAVFASLRAGFTPVTAPVLAPPKSH